METLRAWRGVQGGGVVATPNIDYNNVFGGSGVRASADFQLLAAANGGIYNVTTTPALLGSGFLNNRWQTEMFNNKLVFVNGQDTPQEFDGTTLTALTLWQLWDPNAIAPGEGAFIPFPNPEEFIGCVSFKGRMYYWKIDEQKFYYAQAGGYTNELFEFDLANVVQQGGAIKTIFTWTVDPGVGPDDMIVFLFETGEFLVYQGDDPGNVGFFEQVGRFNMPDPISIRCTVKYGGDVIVLTRSGYVSMSSVMKGTELTADFPAFSRKIGRLLLDDSQRNSAFYGHEALQTDSGFLMFNMPSSDIKSHQYTRNPNTGAWARLEGYESICWEVFNNGTFFGGYDGNVYRVGGFNDNGEPISLDAIPAFNYFDNPGVQKQIVASQIISTHPLPALIGLTGIADFNIPVVPNIQAPPGSTLEGGSQWNESYWSEDPLEVDYYWTRSGGVTGGTTKGWQNVHAFGFAVTVIVQMKVESQQIQWRQTGIRYRQGGAQ